MKEIQIRKKFKEEALKYDWKYWIPPRVRWGKEKDIFSVFDCCCITPNGRVYFIQLTTKENIKNRIKKIKKWLASISYPNPYFIIQIWGWDKKKKKFFIHTLE